MRSFLLLLSCSFLLAACGGTKQIELSSLSQTPCKNEAQIESGVNFSGETVEGLRAHRLGDDLYVSMAVRTFCSARITFIAEKKGNQIKLFLKNSPAVKGSCVCTTYVSTSLRNIEPGDYNIIIMNEKGDRLLASSEVTID